MNRIPKTPARTADLTVIFSNEEKDDFRRKCTAIGSRCGTEARRILNAWNPVHTNIRPARRRMECPSHGHLEQMTNRATRGGAPRPARL